MKPEELFTRFTPERTAGKIIQYPLTRILISFLFLLPVFVINKIVKSGIYPSLPDNFIAYARYIEALVFFGLFIYAFVLYAKYVEKRKASEILHKNFAKYALVGFLLSGIIAGIVVLIFVISGCLTYSGLTGHKRLVLDLLAKFFMGAFLEELIFRLIIFKLTEELLGTWYALIIQAVLFGFAHFANENATIFTSFAVTIIGGWLYSAGYIYSRSLWLPLGLHWGWNFIQSGVFSMPNSGTVYEGLLITKISGSAWLTGGAFGIEASYVSIALCFVAGLILVFLAKRNSMTIIPWRSRKS